MLPALGSYCSVRLGEQLWAAAGTQALLSARGRRGLPARGVCTLRSGLQLVKGILGSSRGVSGLRGHGQDKAWHLQPPLSQGAL